MNQEAQFEKDRKSESFRPLHTKVAKGTTDTNPAEKKARHLQEKARVQAKRGPGHYPIQNKDTSFKNMTKREMMQFFNSTENRFGNENMNVTRNTQLGPGSYDLHRGSVGR